MIAVVLSSSIAIKYDLMFTIKSTLHHVLSSSLLLGKHLVHVGYRKENSNLLVIGLPAERYADPPPSY